MICYELVMAEGDPARVDDRDDEVERRLRELGAEIFAAPPIREAATREAGTREAAPAKPGAHAADPGIEPQGHAWRYVVSVVVLAFVAAAGSYTWTLIHSPATAPRSRQPAPSAPAPGAAAAKPHGAPADPFAGTPADHWADGVAGISVPPAAPQGEFTAAQVHAAYQATRQLLTAGNLDWPTLRGGVPTAFASLLTSAQRAEFYSGLDRTGLDRQGFPLSTRTWVTSFAPGTASFVTSVVKVHGTMSAGTAILSGSAVLRVQVDYMFVYAVEPPGHPADWMRVVVQDVGHVDFARWDDPGGALEPWVSTGGAVSGEQCGVPDGYIHPAYRDGARSAVQPSGAPVNPYSTAAPSQSGTAACHPTTGT